MFATGNNSEITRKLPAEKVQEIFDDFESKSNLVGLADLLLKIAKRNPKLWAEIQKND